MELLTAGMMRIGWATPTFPAGRPLGSDDKSYAYDGYLVSAKYTTANLLFTIFHSLFLSFRLESGTAPQRALVIAGPLVTLSVACSTLKKRP